MKTLPTMPACARVSISRFLWHSAGASFAVAGMLALGACSGPTSPSSVTSIPYGTTTFVVLVNPVINSINAVTVPTPGSTRSGVSTSVAGGPSATTNSSGVAVLAPLTAGTKTLALSGGGDSGQLSLAIDDRDLREVAVALTSQGASQMANVHYAFGGQVVQVTPTTSSDDVNAALANSNVIVFFRSGTYTSNLTISGSNVTLYGEGPQGGTVVLSGNVNVTGSSNRIRGARIGGGLDVPGSGFGMSFSRVDGALNVGGSGAVFLQNRFCGTVTVTGSNITALGNAGMDPLPATC